MPLKYNPLGSGSHETRKDFVPNPNKENNPNSKTLVILINSPASKPLKVYDGYDARSEIESSLFREAKQAWFIQRPSQNTRAAFRAHAYLTILTMTLTTAYQGWLDQRINWNRTARIPGLVNSGKKSKKKTATSL
jgi:hypothetical protein